MRLKSDGAMHRGIDRSLGWMLAALGLLGFFLLTVLGMQRFDDQARETSEQTRRTRQPAQADIGF